MSSPDPQGSDTPTPRQFTVLARLRRLAPEEGGEKADWEGGQIRPNHNFGDAANTTMFIGFVHWHPPTPFAPGEERDVLIEFFPEELLRSLLTVGRRWRIQAGSKRLGTAEVVAVELG